MYPRLSQVPACSHNASTEKWHSITNDEQRSILRRDWIPVILSHASAATSGHGSSPRQSCGMLPSQVTRNVLKKTRAGSLVVTCELNEVLLLGVDAWARILTRS